MFATRLFWLTGTMEEKEIMHCLSTQESLFWFVIHGHQAMHYIQKHIYLLQEDREGVLRGIYENIQARN